MEAGAESKIVHKRRKRKGFEQKPEVATTPPEERPFDLTDSDAPVSIIRRKSGDDPVAFEPDLDRLPEEPTTVTQQGLIGLRK